MQPNPKTTPTTKTGNDTRHGTARTAPAAARNLRLALNFFISSTVCVRSRPLRISSFVSTHSCWGICARVCVCVCVCVCEVLVGLTNWGGRWIIEGKAGSSVSWVCGCVQSTCRACCAVRRWLGSTTRSFLIRSWWVGFIVMGRETEGEGIVSVMSERKEE